MKNASQAMKNIHGGLTIDKVDQIMYVTYVTPSNTTYHAMRFIQRNILLT